MDDPMAMGGELVHGTAKLIAWQMTQALAHCHAHQVRARRF
jgi:hypothetical protein